MCDCAEEAFRRYILAEAEKIKKADEEKKKPREAAVRGQPAPRSKKEILGMSVLACVLLGLLYRGLGRERSRKILAMVGLGWLIPRSSFCEPCPSVTAGRVKWPKCTPDPKIECHPCNDRTTDIRKCNK